MSIVYIRASKAIERKDHVADLEKKLRNDPDLQRYLEEKLSTNAEEYEITTVLQSIDPQLSETTATSPQMGTTHAEMTTEKSTTDDLKTWNKSSSNYYYKLFRDPVNYTTAKANCQKLGADLASVGVRNAAVRSKILQMVKSGEKDTWVALDDINEEGRFVWADGVISIEENTYWNDGQPDDYEDNEDCSEFSGYQSWKLNDARCSDHQYYICEKRPFFWDQ
uniref:C-type lectin domain family 4 member M-like n=1 Tax=Styela clava TaxID=7725 RepID=UPI00193981E4|nr:C-type lectin domain family 4 member M-like [Styela clava]